MGKNTEISWTDHTFNGWWGCTEVSDACDFCYARELAKRFGYDVWGNKPRHRTSKQNWNDPIRWNKEAALAGVVFTVFAFSMGDVFDNQVPEEWRADFWELVRKTPNLIWLILTKRPQNIKKMLPPDWGAGYPNVRLGTTVEHQKAANTNIVHLLAVPAAGHFLSCEPMLGSIDLTRVSFEKGNGDERHKFNALTGKAVMYAESINCELEYLIELDTPIMNRLSWVICGGESGNKARPMHPNWARGLRDQCAAAGVPFHFKQWGEWLPCEAVEDTRRGNQEKYKFFNDLDMTFYKSGKKESGRKLDGRTWDATPKVAA